MGSIFSSVPDYQPLIDFLKKHRSHLKIDHFWQGDQVIFTISIVSSSPTIEISALHLLALRKRAEEINLLDTLSGELYHHCEKITSFGIHHQKLGTTLKQAEKYQEGHQQEIEEYQQKLLEKKEALDRLLEQVEELGVPIPLDLELSDPEIPEKYLVKVSVWTGPTIEVALPKDDPAYKAFLQVEQNS